MAFAAVRRHASVLNFPAFLPLTSSPVFAHIRSRRGRIGARGWQLRMRSRKQATERRRVQSGRHKAPWLRRVNTPSRTNVKMGSAALGALHHVATTGGIEKADE